MKFSKIFFLNLIAASLLTLPMFANSDFNSELENKEVVAQPISKPLSEVIAEETVQNAANYTTSHIRANHIYIGTTLYGDQVEIEDGSFWMTNPDDRLKLFDWFQGDTVLILQNHGSFWKKPTYPYVLENARNGQRIEVEISAAPLWDIRFFIVEIYKPAYGDGWLKLNDGSVWTLFSENKSTWKLWEANDTVVMGTNDSIWNFITPNILVNVTCSQQYVKSRCTN